MFDAVQREARSRRALLKGTFMINNHIAKIMFDSGATYSFIIRGFMLDLGLSPKRYSRSF